MLNYKQMGTSHFNAAEFRYSADVGTHYLCQILIKPVFSRETCGCVPNTKFNHNSSNGRGAVPCRQTDERT
jgi:hypothetical protein